MSEVDPSVYYCNICILLATISPCPLLSRPMMQLVKKLPAYTLINPGKGGGGFQGDGQIGWLLEDVYKYLAWPRVRLPPVTADMYGGARLSARRM
jgi:hypothetical protein